jgi:hypothetical protein
MTRYGFSEDSAVITTSVIPNPGTTGVRRALAGIVAGKAAAGASLLAVAWPAHMALATIWGPAVIGVGVCAATILAVRKRKSAMQLAIGEFADLGVAPEVIGSVIVENRAKAWTVLGYTSQFADAQTQIERIGNEALAIIDGFKDDTSDIHRCRHNLTRWLDQTIKILKNFEVIERRIAGDNSITKDEYQDTYEQTLDGLTKLADALEEQHQRNLDNNQNALEIDIEVSEQLLQ